jgi:thiamine biosynthesis lipoprotein
MVEFRAMASPCRIVADDERLAAAGERLVHELEQRWSRFLASSEVSGVNAANGAVCVISDETRLLVERAEFARVATGGRFNPYVLDHLEAIEAAARCRVPAFEPSGGPVSAAPIRLAASSSAIQLPAGVRFDPGGIGKGLAGDLVVDHLRSLGAETVQVELGGDVRVAGDNWVGGAWNVLVIDPRDRARRLGELTIEAGAVATSSVLGRRWRVAGAEFHHLIDPATGRPSESDLVSVTATSTELWWAEVVAKAALIAGSRAAPRLMTELGVAGLMLDRAGVVTVIESGGPRS